MSICCSRVGVPETLLSLDHQTTTHDSPTWQRPALQGHATPLTLSRAFPDPSGKEGPRALQPPWPGRWARIPAQKVKSLRGGLSRKRPNLYFFHHSFCKFKRERRENFFGEVWFLLALDGPSKTVAMLSFIFPMSYANVLSVHSSVPSMFLLFVANRRVTNGRVPPFPTLRLPAHPPERVKNESPRDFASRKGPVFHSGDWFWIFLGTAGSLETPLKTLFDVLSRGFDCSTRRGGVVSFASIYHLMIKAHVLLWAANLVGQRHITWCPKCLFSRAKLAAKGIMRCDDAARVFSAPKKIATRSGCFLLREESCITSGRGRAPASQKSATAVQENPEKSPVHSWGPFRGLLLRHGMENGTTLKPRWAPSWQRFLETCFEISPGISRFH